MTLYDNEKTMDRYTLVLEKDGEKYFFGMSTNAMSPNGYNQFVGSSFDGMTEDHDFGMIIALDETSEEVQKAIQNRIDNLEEGLKSLLRYQK